MTLTVAGIPLVGYLLASIRIVAWLAVVPPFSSRAVPAMAKVILALGLSFAAVPSVSTISLDAWSMISAVISQVALGATMGFVTYLLFAAIGAAGSLIDIFGGFSLAQGFDPLGYQGNTVFGTFHQMLAMILLFASGGHLLVIGGLIRTFDLVPIGSAVHLNGGTTVLTTAFTMFFVTAVQIALPMIAVLFIADLGLALLTKVAPQLNAINVMFPAKIGLTLMLLGLSLPVLPTAMDRLVELAARAMVAIAGTG